MNMKPKKDPEWAKQQEWIRESIRSKKINHGLVRTDEIYFDERNLNSDKVKVVFGILDKYKYNFLSLAVRSTDEYQHISKDYEYELIYGEEWLFAARQLQLPQVWAWLYDVDKSQANSIRNEMIELFEPSVDISYHLSNFLKSHNEILKRLESIENSLKSQSKSKTKPKLILPININDPNLDAETLGSLGLKGIREITAEKILAYRDERGKISNFSELKSITKQWFKPEEWQKKGLICEPIQ